MKNDKKKYITMAEKEINEIIKRQYHGWKEKRYKYSPIAYIGKW